MLLFTAVGSLTIVPGVALADAQIAPATSIATINPWLSPKADESIDPGKLKKRLSPKANAEESVTAIEGITGSSADVDFEKCSSKGGDCGGKTGLKCCLGLRCELRGEIGTCK